MSAAMALEPDQPHPPLDTGALLRQLVARRGEFLAFVERRVGDRAQAEDILQDAFTKSIEHLGELRSPVSATAWFYRVLRNASVEVYRRRDRRERLLTAVEIEASIALREPEFDSVDAGCSCVTEIVGGLAPQYAEALQRIEVEGVAVKQFAAEQGISANNAAVRVHRARKALARGLEDCCGGCLTDGCGDCSCDH